MILLRGHVARVHPTAKSPFAPFAGTNPGSAPNFRVARDPGLITTCRRIHVNYPTVSKTAIAERTLFRNEGRNFQRL